MAAVPNEAPASGLNRFHASRRPSFPEQIRSATYGLIALLGALAVSYYVIGKIKPVFFGYAVSKPHDHLKMSTY
jgi:hypothetical protein